MAVRAPRGLDEGNEMIGLRNSVRARSAGWLVVVGAVAVAATVFAASAGAVPPVTSDQVFASTNDLTGVCPFTIRVDSEGTGRESDFYDHDGTQTGALIHVVEQDVFTANGKTLQSLPYTFELHFDGAPPNFAHIYSTGIVSRIPLPDGRTFLSAGRVDFVAHPGAGFLLTPDVGRSGNVAGFCAALS